MCLCGDSQCPSCGLAQGTLEGPMSPQPWRVERGFAVARIVAADDSVVAENLAITDAEAIMAALGVVRQTQALWRIMTPEIDERDGERMVHDYCSGSQEMRAALVPMADALAAYDEATR